MGLWGNHSRLRMALSAMAVLGAIATPAQAAPGGDATIMQASLSLGFGGKAAAVAMCPAGRRAVGGGAAPTLPSLPQGYISASGPVDETEASPTDGEVARGWRAVLTDVGSTSYKVFAICSASSDATVITNQFGVGENASGGAEAECPAGRQALSGGVAALGAGDLENIMYSSRPSFFLPATGGQIAGKWSVRVKNGLGERNYRVFALCSAASDALLQRKPLGAEATAAAPCPAGRRALGGGIGPSTFNTPPFVGVNAPQNVTNNGDVARAWLGTLLQTSANGYETYGLCATDDVTGSGGGGGGGGAEPALTSIRSSRSVFAVGSASTPVTGRTSRKRTPRGTVFSFRLDKAATVSIVFQRQVTGRRSSGKCRAASRKLRKKPKCKRWAGVSRSTLIRTGHAGVNKVGFSGRVRGKAFKPGRYRARFTASSGGAKSKTANVGFRIVRR